MNHCVPGVDGRHYAGFGLVPSLVAVPVVAFGDRIAALFHVNSPGVSRVMVSIFTALVSAVSCMVVAMWIVRLGYSRQTAILGAGVLGLASPFWHFGVKGFYSEPYVTLALLLAAYFLSNRESPRAAGYAGLAFGVACGCRVNTVIFFPVFILCLALQVRARGWMRARFLGEAGLFTASFSICALLIGLANYTRFGSPFKTGYHLAYPSVSLLFSTPLWKGVSGLMLNGEIGLLIFAPWTILALVCFPSFVRAHLPESVLCGSLFLLNFLFFAKYDSWHAGWVAGPRFLTPTLPFLIMAMLPCIERLWRLGENRQGSPFLVPFRVTLVVLVVAAGLVQIFGALYPEERYYCLMGLSADTRLLGFYGTTPAIMELYKGSRRRLWWAGSIPLGSIDFWRVCAVRMHEWAELSIWRTKIRQPQRSKKPGSGRP